MDLGQTIRGNKGGLVMKEHQERVIQEQKELNEKITKLGDFLGDYDKRLIPSQAEYSLLCRQFDVMQSYNEILMERISLYEEIRKGV